MSGPLNPSPPNYLEHPVVPPAEFISQPPTVPVDDNNENPPWTFLDVLLLAAVFFVLINIMLAMTAAFVGTIHLFGYDISQLTRKSEALDRFAHDPRVILPVQSLAYLLLFAMMLALVRMRQPAPRGFFQTMRWHWPCGTWPGFVVAGIILAIVIQLATQWLPIPPSLPIEKFFQTSTYAYLMAGFGIFIAPVVEEIFFRGFLYPVLARPLGVGAAVVLTSLAFMLVHGAQLGYSWAALLVLFVVALVLTLVRALKRSVAAAVLVHMGYNATLFAFLFIASDGFKRLDRM